MTIANYISDLLYRYECVILPGFGAILTNRQPAQINKGTHTFTPPKKTLSFNRQLVQNDGLLVNYISKTENVSYEAALEKLQQFVHFIEIEMEEGKKVEIEKVGTFTLSSEEKVLFEPDTRINYLTEAYGLDSFTSEAIGRGYKITPEVPATAAANTMTTESTKIRSIGPYLKYTAIGLIAMGITGFAGFQIYNNQLAEYNIAEQQKAETQIEQEIQQATFIIENPLPAVTLKLPKQNPGNFHIVAGAFRVQENAEKKVQELRDLGYKAKQIGVNKYGLHQVIYSSFQTRAEALNQLREIQTNLNESAWLLIQEL